MILEINCVDGLTTKIPRSPIIGVYKIINPNGRIYVGSSVDIYRRWATYRGKPLEKQIKLYRSFRKYGIMNHIFQVVLECGIDILLKEERRIGLEFNVLGTEGLNSMLPNDGENKALISEALRQRMSISKKEYNKKNPQSVINHKKKLVEYYSDETKRAYQSKKAIEYYENNPDALVKMSNRMTKYFSCPKNKEAQSKKTSEYFKRDGIREKHSNIKRNYFINNPDAVTNMSEKTKLYFSDPKQRERMRDATTNHFKNAHNRDKMRGKKCKFIYTIKNILTDALIVIESVTLFCQQNNMQSNALLKTLTGKDKNGRTYNHHKNFKIIKKETKEK